ncbi:MAG: trigger factor [Pelagibacteraceae bacterium]|nr:trigger factor [Pelagibacteraceae bacterium]|tara:strand:+ start:5530 stop:6870 length:1341 start_codon:yes stop_codon:yes gene_type:complete
MEVKEIQSKKLLKEYELEIPSNEIKKHIDDKLQELAVKSKLPGFRPGKAPLNLIRQKYEKDILGEVVNKTIQENTKKLIEDKKLKPLRVPKVEIKDFDKSKSLKFHIKIDLPPEINLANFKDINIESYKISIKKEDVDKEYNNFANSQVHYHSLKINRQLKKDDQVIISFTSNDEGVPDSLKKVENLPIVIGSKLQILPNLDKLLLEKKVKKDDKIFVDISLPKTDNNEKKETYKFSVTIHDIREPHKTKINDEFLKKINLKSTDELKKRIELNLLQQYETIGDEISKKQLLDILEKKHSFDLPEGILEDEFNSIWSRVQEAQKNNTLDPDDKSLDQKKLENRYKKIAERRVKLALIVSNIANVNSINVNEQELQNALLNYAKNYPGQEKQIFEYFQKNPSEVETIRGPLFEKKVIEFVKKQAKIVEKKVTPKDLYAIQEKIFKQE